MDVKLRGKHLIMFSRLIYKLGFKPDLKGKTTEEFGFGLFWDIMSHAHFAEKELWDLVGEIMKETPEVCQEMELDELKDTFMFIYQKVVNYFKKPVTE